MTGNDNISESQDGLVQGTRLRRERQRRFAAEGEPSVTRRLAQIGVLGWIIVTPTLIGVFAGHWLDARFHSGLFCTGPLLMLGLAVGCWSAWRWVKNA
ncbi:MAG TPA: AtpZ/AtpI family protein [Acetobacteraceae bacterium]|nr:AtpZ/AtpI family protein [Acetobacteraceae bacterium]